MADEATVQVAMNIRKGNRDYRPQPTQFRADVAGSVGQTPGEILVSTGGTAVSLAQLTAMGGLCRIQNLDATNRVTVGVWTGAVFIPFQDILPGEFYPLRLSQELLTGDTGTASVNSLRIKARVASCRVLVEAFDP